MTENKNDPFAFMDICDNCKCRKEVHKYNDLKLCLPCEEIFFEGLIKCEEQKEFGQNIVNNDLKKKSY